jgi:S-DNA-T family DNA segregation ATPase FtsK/SpoIIIE
VTDGPILVGTGISDDGCSVVPVGLDLPVGCVVPVLGPPGSGRSTALAVLAAEARRAGRDVVVVSMDTPATADGLATARRRVILVDDADALPPNLAAALEEAAPTASVVVATTASAVLGAYGGLLGAARAARTGVLLGAVRPGDGEVFGLRLGPAPAGPPGRGLLVRRGRTVALQVLLPDVRAPDDGETGGPQREDDAASLASASPSTRHVVQSGCGSAPRER